MNCPTCGSDEYVSNGVDGYICLECSTQFFVDDEYGPVCPNCGATFFEDFDEITREYICFCGKNFGGVFADENEEK